MKAAVLHEAFSKIDDRLIMEAENGTFNEEIRKQKTFLIKRIIAVAACVFIVVTVFMLKDTVMKGKYPYFGGPMGDESQYLLDSNIAGSTMSGEEIVSFINEYDASSIDDAFVYLNSSSAIGTAMNVTRAEDPECLSGLVSMVFNDKFIYTETSSAYDSKGYSFYITYTNTRTSESFTVFIFDNETIKIDGVFLKASTPLDYKTVNKALKEFRTQE